jgi:tRNA/rRNA methyltransferase
LSHLPEISQPPLHIHPLDRLTVVLVSPRNTLNIGAVARAMSNFGAHDLRVANIFYKEFRSATSAVGPSAALLRSARDYPTTGEAVHDAQLVVGTSGAASDKPWLQPLERLEAGAVRMRAALDRGQRVALLFGSEKFGLSNDDMSHCHLLLRIPTRDEHPSMNLGQAAALCLYELARMDPGASPSTQAAPERVTHWLPQDFPRDAGDHTPAPAESVERLTLLLEQALAASEFPGMGSPTRTRQLRTLIRRLRFSERDSTLATGFLRQMLWKLRGGPEQR